MMATKLDKVVRIGTVEVSAGAPRASVYAHIKVDDAGELHITGVEGPKHNGNAAGASGQIVMSYRTPEGRARISPAPGWDAATIARFFDVWERWHLNHMKAGSPAQTAWLEANPIPADETRYPASHYEVASAKLAAAGLNPDPDFLYSGPNSRPAEPHPYKYGEAWLREEVPADVLDFLASLPVADMAPAWV